MVSITSHSESTDTCVYGVWVCFSGVRSSKGLKVEVEEHAEDSKRVTTNICSYDFCRTRKGRDSECFFAYFRRLVAGVVSGHGLSSRWQRHPRDGLPLPSRWRGNHAPLRLDVVHALWLPACMVDVNIAWLRPPFANLCSCSRNTSRPFV